MRRDYFMSILLILCVLAAAGWLVLSVADRRVGDDPGDSVAEYSRAMAALAPADARGHRQQAARRPSQRQRTGAGPAGRGQAMAHRAAARTPTAARRRPVRR